MSLYSHVQRADFFILSHTKSVLRTEITSPPNTECPICLDGIDDHICVKITNHNGCNHLIGFECLREMLQHNPNEKKQCPLCRAEWISENPANGVWQNSRQSSAQALSSRNLGLSPAFRDDFLPSGPPAWYRDRSLRSQERRSQDRAFAAFADAHADLVRAAQPVFDRGSNVEVEFLNTMISTLDLVEAARSRGETSPVSEPRGSSGRHGLSRLSGSRFFRRSGPSRHSESSRQPDLTRAAEPARSLALPSLSQHQDHRST